MHLDREYVEGNIFIGEWYDQDEAEKDSKGELCVGVQPTMVLEREADECMKARGFMPFFNGGEPAAALDLDGWYNFFLVCREGRVEEIYVEIDGTKQDAPNFSIYVDEETRKYLTRQMVKLFGSERWKEIFPQWTGKEYT